MCIYEYVHTHVLYMYTYVYRHMWHYIYAYIYQLVDKLSEVRTAYFKEVMPWNRSLLWDLM